MRRFATHLATALSDFARQLWVYVALALLLTTIMGAFAGIADPARLSSLFVGNLLLSISIAASMQVGFASVARSLWSERAPRFMRLVLGALVFVACVLAGSEPALFGIAIFAPSMVYLFPRAAVWTVSLPVSLAMMGVGLLHERAEHARRQKREVERALEETRLAALSARTDPHFLFNSLNSVAALIEENPRAAERAVLKLASMFRYVLDGSRAPWVTLGQELELTRCYLELEELRFEARLQVSIELEPGLESVAIPPLVLQPLVENAVRHGIASRTGAGQVAVRIRKLDAMLELCVDDDGPGPDGSVHRGAQTSQRDLSQRLVLLYGERARFETGRSPLGGFRANLRLPIFR